MKPSYIVSKIFSLKIFSLKFLTLAIIVLNIPLIFVFMYVVFGNSQDFDLHSLAYFPFIMLSLSSFFTLIIFNNLIRPFFETKENLKKYVYTKLIEETPVYNKDEIGVFMSEIIETIKSLDELVKEKQDLLGLMAHNLKNPLTAVITYTELLEVEEKFRPIKDKIMKATQSQKDIISSVLEMLKYDSVTYINEEVDNINLLRMVNGIIDKYSHKQLEKNINLIINLKANSVKGKRLLIDQVLENVYTNSLKFTEDGTIIISSENIENDMVRITFEDTGIGFDKEVGELLFDRFTKYKRKGTKNESTTGLGLYLSKKIVTQHKGTIVATSDGTGMGSKFIITLQKFE